MGYRIRMTRGRMMRGGWVISGLFMGHAWGVHRCFQGGIIVFWVVPGSFMGRAWGVACMHPGQPDLGQVRRQPVAPGIGLPSVARRPARHVLPDICPAAAYLPTRPTPVSGVLTLRTYAPFGDVQKQADAGSRIAKASLLVLTAGQQASEFRKGK